MFTFQIFQNIGMTMGIMPIGGIPLPFLSHGGSSTVVLWPPAYWLHQRLKTSGVSQNKAADDLEMLAQC